MIVRHEGNLKKINNETNSVGKKLYKSPCPVSDQLTVSRSQEITIIFMSVKLS